MKPCLKEARIRTKKEVKTYYDLYKLTQEQKELGKGKTYFLKTYGCQMNEHDSENIKAILEEMSYTSVDSIGDADVIILNTCAIRENADNKVFGMIGRMKNLKQRKPNIITGICGCMAQTPDVIEEIKTKFNFLDFVLGTHNFHEIPLMIKESLKEHKLKIRVLSIEGDIIENIPVKRDSKYKAWVNIMYGCDKFCTYCIVPYTRGKQRSRSKEDILKEIIDLKEQGYKEVTLLGQNVNAYAKDLNTNYNMANLLEDVAKTGIERIRFVTSHPWDFNDDMINVIKKHDNIMPYIHLPIQSGSNRILKLMGRRYTRESYIELFNKLKEIKSASITTDIIVGFPNETKEDFKDTLDIVNTCKFDGAYTFIYSKREGTPAANMEDKITLEEKEQRLQKLNKLVNKYSKENNLKYLNKEVKVLLENISPKDKNTLSGYTETMKLVNVKCDKEYLGKIVTVKITDVKTWSMNGELKEIE